VWKHLEAPRFDDWLIDWRARLWIKGRNSLSQLQWGKASRNEAGRRTVAQTHQVLRKRPRRIGYFASEANTVGERWTRSVAKVSLQQSAHRGRVVRKGEQERPDRGFEWAYSTPRTWKDPWSLDSGELVVLRKADWTRVFGGLKLRPLELVWGNIPSHTRRTARLSFHGSVLYIHKCYR
jgi:hypothetical protein